MTTTYLNGELRLPDGRHAIPTPELGDIEAVTSGASVEISGPGLSTPRVQLQLDTGGTWKLEVTRSPSALVTSVHGVGGFVFEPSEPGSPATVELEMPCDGDDIVSFAAFNASGSRQPIRIKATHVSDVCSSRCFMGTWMETSHKATETGRKLSEPMKQFLNDGRLPPELAAEFGRDSLDEDIPVYVRDAASGREGFDATYMQFSEEGAELKRYYQNPGPLLYISRGGNWKSNDEQELVMTAPDAFFSRRIREHGDTGTWQEDDGVLTLTANHQRRLERVVSSLPGIGYDTRVVDESKARRRPKAKSYRYECEGDRMTLNPGMGNDPRTFVRFSGS